MWAIKDKGALSQFPLVGDAEDDCFVRRHLASEVGLRQGVAFPFGFARLQSRSLRLN